MNRLMNDTMTHSLRDLPPPTGASTPPTFLFLYIQNINLITLFIAVVILQCKLFNLTGNSPIVYIEFIDQL